MEPKPFNPQPVTLRGRYVTLEPITPEHFEPLWLQAQDPDIWTWMLNDGPASATDFRAYFDPMLASHRRGDSVAFAVRRNSDDQVVGTTRLFDFHPNDRGLEIGYTWYGPSARATEVNPESKYLLMSHCFEELGANRVQLKTDERNARSRAAMLKMGAQYEGTLRRFQTRVDGWARNTAVFSVIAEEWPAVKAGLESRLRY